MIWYDSVDKAPVAPGGCEDGGTPSIEGYLCKECGNFGDPVWSVDQVMVDYKTKPILLVGSGSCDKCGFYMLTTIV